MTASSSQARLSQALAECDLASVVKALKQGADPNWYPRFSMMLSPMEEAAQTGFIAGLEALHHRGGEVNFKGYLNGTPLMMAAKSGQTEAGRWLLRHGADETAATNHQETPLQCALVSRHLVFADMLLVEKPELQSSGLQQAAKGVIRMANFDVAHWLLKHGVSPNLTDGLGRPWLMLSQALRSNDAVAIMDLLLKVGADVNLPNTGGETALHEALKEKFAPGFLRLLQSGADPDIADQKGRSVRRLIGISGYEDIRGAFQAWENSHRAHQIIHEIPGRTLPRAL